jgi:predicted O-linked N-acetylglucosamine transferase (SPINDLY family)
MVDASPARPSAVDLVHDPLPRLSEWWQTLEDDAARTAAAQQIYQAMGSAIADYDPERVVGLFQLANGWFGPAESCAALLETAWFAIHAAEPDFRLGRRCFEDWWRHPATQAALPQQRVRPRDTTRGGRPGSVQPLRLGIMAVNFFNNERYYEAIIAPTVRVLPRERFRLHAYNHSAEPAVAAVQQDFDVCRTFDVADGVAHEIAADGLDVLLFCNGLMTTPPLSILAARPARRLALWLHTYAGYGPTVFDGALLDRRLQSPLLDAVLDEPQIALERMAALIGLDINAPPAGPVPSLTGKPVTFGVFNRPTKLSEPSVRCWRAILDRVPHARLVLANYLYDTDRWRTFALDLCARCGIGADRVSVLPFAQQAEDYLGYYDQIDVALDTYPFNGGLTTLDAIGQGVPVVTWVGDDPHARAGYCLLDHLGLGDLVARSAEDYVAIATALAADLPRRVTLRATLRDRLMASPLVNPDGFAAAFEDALRRLLATPSVEDRAAARG